MTSTGRALVRALRNPVVLFLVIGTLTVIAVVGGVNYLADRAAADEAISEARATNEVLAQSVALPDIKSGLLKSPPGAGAIDRFDRTVLERLLVESPKVRHVNIYTASGRLIYSDLFAQDASLAGQVVDLDADQRRVLRDGGTGSQPSDPTRPETPGNEGNAELVQIYTRMLWCSEPSRCPESSKQPLLFEAYYSLNQIEGRRQEIFGAFRWITVGPFLALIVIVSLMLRFLTRQLITGAKDRERLLRSAIDASDAERRRIARDLHDGVVQDLAGTAYSISAVSRDPRTPVDVQAHLDGAGATLRTSLKSLRSLLAEIHPPELDIASLASALEDLIAPAAAAGIAATVSVEGADRASDAQAALVWRVAQEAVRNAIRHSRATTLQVTVRGYDGGLALEVVDDGVGFDPGVREPDRFGLRGLRSLVTDVEGELEVRSEPGRGTTVLMEVER